MTSSWITTIKRTAATVFTAAAVLVSGCSSPETSDTTSLNSYKYEQELNIIDDNFRNYYQIFVGSFCDSNGDGIGDLNGITSKLDYIQDMGFNGIWLTPIMPSRSYHKYSVEDYYSIDPQFGTMEDFENLSAECEKRGISLLIDLVMNHSSRYHPWFESASQSLRQEPCGAPAEEDCLSETLCPVHNKYVGYYYFEDEKPAGSAAWYQTGTKWYQAVFSENMPELQLDNPDVREEFKQIAKFWLDKGIGGFRLDAVKEYFTGNPDKNVEVLNWFCDYCHSINPGCYIVGEVWESFTTYTKYYASSIDSVFGFTMAESDGKIAKTVNLSGKANSAESFAQAMATVEQTIADYSERGIDAPFIGNHDTDRIAGILRYDPARIKEAAGLLLTMSGSPFVYYGDEIGLSGSGRDENKRAPMIWDDNGSGLTYGPPDMERQENRFESVEKQLSDPDSILNYYKRALRIRNENPEIARGTTEVLELSGNSGGDIAAVRRTWNGSSILIVYNLSDEAASLSDAALELDSRNIRGYLAVSSGDEPSLSGELEIPPHSIVFLK